MCHVQHQAAHTAAQPHAQVSAPSPTASAAARRASAERLMCAMHVVAALVGADEGVARLEGALVADLVGDLQSIIGRHAFVTVRARAQVQRRMC